MWQKLKDFTRKDPVLFVAIIIVIIVGFTFANVEVLHYTSEPEFCQNCHPAEKVGPLGEYYTWEKSLHATAEVECLDCHGDPGIIGYMEAKIGGLKDLYGEFFKSQEHKMEILMKGATDKEYAAELVPNETCMHCHTDSVNKKHWNNRLMNVGIDFRLIDSVHNPGFRKSFGRPDIMEEGVDVGVKPNHKFHIEEVGLNCVDCHLGVAHDGKLHNLPKMATCFECHHNEREKNPNISAPENMECAECHKLQVDIQAGTFAKEQGVDNLKWYMESLACTDCHTDPYARPTTETCVQCHDSSYGDLMVMFQDTFESRLSKIEKDYKELFHERLEMPEGKRELFLDLKRLVRAMQMDGSSGVHNPDYFSMMMDKAEALIEKIHNYDVESAEGGYKSLIERKEEGEMIGGGEEKEKAEKEEKKVSNPPELVAIAPDTINLAERHNIETTKKPVIFDHKMHYQNFECSECHDKPESGTLKADLTKFSGMNNSFHQELCFPCHKEERVPRGTSCNTCHK